MTADYPLFVARQTSSVDRHGNQRPTLAHLGEQQFGQDPDTGGRRAWRGSAAPVVLPWTLSGTALLVLLAGGAVVVVLLVRRNRRPPAA